MNCPYCNQPLSHEIYQMKPGQLQYILFCENEDCPVNGSIDMREHKYKAKRIDNNEWVEGYFWQNECGNYFIRVTFENNKIIIKDYEIDPETICEFTGKIDSNNKKIYQNDIIAFWIGDKLIYKILVWYNEMGYMTAVPIDGIQGNKIIGYYSLRYPYYTYETFCSMFKDTDYSKIEVIGNIVDNPELLEGNND